MRVTLSCLINCWYLCTVPWIGQRHFPQCVSGNLTIVINFLYWFVNYTFQTIFQKIMHPNYFDIMKSTLITIDCHNNSVRFEDIWKDYHHLLNSCVNSQFHSWFVCHCLKKRFDYVLGSSKSTQSLKSHALQDLSPLIDL